MYVMTDIEKELIQTKLNSVYQAIEASNDIQNLTNKSIMESLARIEEKVTKTNGSIAKANIEIAANRQKFEDEINSLKLTNATHTLHCPVKPKVDKIDRKLVYYAGLVTGIVIVVEILFKLYVG